MLSRRRKSRETVLKVLYQMEIAPRVGGEALKDVLMEEHYRPLLERFGRELANLSELKGEAAAWDIESFACSFADQFIAKGILYDSDPNALGDFVASFRQQVPTAEDKKNVDRLKESFQMVTEIEGFARLLIEKTLDNLPDINKALQSVADNWALDRMAVIDRVILRFATCELLHFPDIPVNVTLNEAIELSRKFSTDRSPEFVNGVLDKIQREHKPLKQDVPRKMSKAASKK
ncbi:MAG: transcription antitermination factor NusB [Candidatus Riflebacteria bacterium]|nr:transcription antitermination factor NusB [Candidatus Riflebacteria bacterium]